MIQTTGSRTRALGRTSNGRTQSPRTWERQFAEEEYARTEALLVLAQAIEEARGTLCCLIAFPGGSLCKPGELPNAFQGLRVLRYEEPVAKPDFAPRPARVVRFAAEKPVE